MSCVSVCGCKFGCVGVLRRCVEIKSIGVVVNPGKPYKQKKLLKTN